MIRALLESGTKLKVLVLNQSEEKTSSADLKARLEEHYNNGNLSVEVRRHPNYTKATSPTQKLLKRFDGLKKMVEKHQFHDARINNRQVLPAKFEKLIKKTIATGRYDIAWFNYMKMLPSTLPKTNTKIVVDMHDMQSERIKSDVLPTIEKSRRKKYLNTFINSEKSGLDNCDLAISISPVETDAIQIFYKPKAKMVTLKASDDPKFQTSTQFKQDIVFIGSNSAPNVDGLKWFIEAVLPSIVEQKPDTKFLIQGNVNRNKLIKDAIATSSARKNITQQGFAESLTEVYQSARVIICPIRYGTGMKIKVVEGMAYGKAIVGTPIAYEGIDTSKGLACEKDAAAFAESTLLFINNDEARRAAEEAAKSTFTQGHSYLALKKDIAERILK